MSQPRPAAAARRHAYAKGGGFLFTGAITPHDAATGKLITNTGALPEAIKGTRAGLMFFDVPEYTVLAQTYAAYNTLAQLLADNGLSFRHLVRQRLFVRDIRTLPAIERVMDIVLGDKKPATTVIVVPERELNPELHVYIDAIANLGNEPARVIAAGAPSRYPGALVANNLVFTSSQNGLHGQTTQDNADDAKFLATPRQRRIYRESLQTFANLAHVLEQAGSSIPNILKVNGWVDFPMRDYGATVLARRRYFDQTKKQMMASTGLAVGGTSDPEAIVAFDAIAVVDGLKQGGKDVSGIASPIASPYVAGAVKGGGLVFTSGEIPVLVPDGIVMDRCDRLPDEGRLIRLGHIEAESGMESRAWFTYRTLEAHLAALGASFKDVVHQTVFIEHPREFPILERVATMFFGATLPPTTIIPIADTTPFRPAELEIELIAT
jgi:enamine deaminase RidA (YjgF/YER057c/UK114 family)